MAVLVSAAESEKLFAADPTQGLWLKLEGHFLHSDSKCWDTY